MKNSLQEHVLLWKSCVSILFERWHIDDIFYHPGAYAFFFNNKYYDYFFGPPVNADDVIQTIEKNKSPFS